MVEGSRILLDFPVEELDRELIIRGARNPREKLFKFGDREGTREREVIMARVAELYDAAAEMTANKALQRFSTGDISGALIDKLQGIDGGRGQWYGRMDIFQVRNEQIKKNALSVAAICRAKSLIATTRGSTTLKIKNYKKVFNLCDSEPFHQQPIVAGRLCTGFLVKEDVIATAGHCVNENNLTDLRIVFGYKMSDSTTPETEIPGKNIYKGTKIIRKICRRMGNQSDWALIRLDRNVVGQQAAVLSGMEVTRGQSVYLLGHPVGLPLKYARGVCVSDIEEAYFGAQMDVYCGNSGSPVFDSETHEVIGIVVRGDSRDFRWTGRGWISVLYPNPVIRTQKPQCTRVSEFRNIVAGERCRGERDR